MYTKSEEQEAGSPTRSLRIRERLTLIYMRCDKCEEPQSEARWWIETGSDSDFVAGRAWCRDCCQREGLLW